MNPSSAKRTGPAVVLSMLITGWMVACAPSVAAVTPTQVAPVTSTHGLPTRTETPVSLATAMVSPTATGTPTAMPRPTHAAVIPAATLSPADQPRYVATLVAFGDVCRLPCWLGVTPGLSDVNDILTALSPLGVRYGGQIESRIGGQRQYVFPMLYGPDSMMPVQSNFAVDDEGFVKSVVAAGRATPGADGARRIAFLWISEIVDQLGNPDRATLFARGNPGSAGTPLPYEINLYYDDLLIWMNYSLYGVDAVGDNLRACPRLSQLESVTLYVGSRSEQGLDLDSQIAGLMQAYAFTHPDRALPLADLVATSETDFLISLSNDGSSQCLVFPPFGEP